MELYTNAGMSSNIAIDRHLGFADTRRRIGRGFDRVYLALALPAPQ